MEEKRGKKPFSFPGACSIFEDIASQFCLGISHLYNGIISIKSILEPHSLQAMELFQLCNFCYSYNSTKYWLFKTQLF